MHAFKTKILGALLPLFCFLTLKPYFKSLLVDLKYVYTKSGVVHSGNNVW